MIVILHGWRSNLLDWIPVVKQLSNEYRVIIPDLPGFGSSSKPTSTWNIREYGKFVESFLSTLKVKDYSLVGHSMGGRIAAAMAAKSRNDIDKLFLVSPGGAEKRKFSTKIKITLVKTLNKLPLIPTPWKSKVATFFASRDYKDAGSMLKTFKAIVRENIYSDIKKISVPTIIIWGDKDAEVPVENSKTLKRLLPKATVRVVWGVGHSMHIEKPEELIALLREYL